MVIDARLPANEGVRRTIISIRNDLLAEHLGVTPDEVSVKLAPTGSLIAAIEERHRTGKTLKRFVAPALNAAGAFIADNEVLDPEKAGGFFEPLATRGLFRQRALPAPD